MLILSLVTAAALSLVIVALAIPVALTFRVDMGERNNANPLQAKFAIQWLFGLAKFRWESPDKNSSHKTAERRKPGRPRVQKHRKQHASAAFLAVLRQPGFRRRGYRLVRDLVRAAHFSELRLRLRLGLEDPADTGRLWALLGPLQAVAQNLRHAEVRIEPEFVAPAFDIRASGNLHFVPLRILGLVFAFVLSPSSIKAWYTMASRYA